MKQEGRWNITSFPRKEAKGRWVWIRSAKSLLWLKKPQKHTITTTLWAPSDISIINHDITEEVTVNQFWHRKKKTRPWWYSKFSEPCCIFSKCAVSCQQSVYSLYCGMYVTSTSLSGVHGQQSDYLRGQNRAINSRKKTSILTEEAVCHVYSLTQRTPTTGPRTSTGPIWFGARP